MFVIGFFLNLLIYLEYRNFYDRYELGFIYLLYIIFIINVFLNVDCSNVMFSFVLNFILIIWFRI